RTVESRANLVDERVLARSRPRGVVHEQAARLVDERDAAGFVDGDDHFAIGSVGGRCAARHCAMPSSGVPESRSCAPWRNESSAPSPKMKFAGDVLFSTHIA